MDPREVRGAAAAGAPPPADRAGAIPRAARRRGRDAGLVIAKTRGEATRVGPCPTGEPEGPCRPLPVAPGAPEAPGAREPEAALEEALGDVLERCLGEAATP